MLELSEMEFKMTITNTLKILTKKNSPGYHMLGHETVLVNFKRLKLYGEKMIF